MNPEVIAALVVIALHVVGTGVPLFRLSGAEGSRLRWLSFIPVLHLAPVARLADLNPLGITLLSIGVSVAAAFSPFAAASPVGIVVLLLYGWLWAAAANNLGLGQRLGCLNAIPVFFLFAPWLVWSAYSRHQQVVVAPIENARPRPSASPLPSASVTADERDLSFAGRDSPYLAPPSPSFRPTTEPPRGNTHIVAVLLAVVGALIAAVSVLATVLVIQKGDGGSNPATLATGEARGRDRTPATHAPATATPVPSTPTPPPTPTRVPVIILNGTEMQPRDGGEGPSTLTVNNGTTQDAIVKLADVSTGRTLSAVYVVRQSEWTIQGIPPGTYWIRFASGLIGTTWTYASSVRHVTRSSWTPCCSS